MIRYSEKVNSRMILLLDSGPIVREETLKNPPKAILRKDYNDIIPKIVIYNDQVMRRSNRDFNMPPPPGQTSSIGLLSVPGERGI